MQQNPKAPDAGLVKKGHDVVLSIGHHSDTRKHSSKHQRVDASTSLSDGTRVALLQPCRCRSACCSCLERRRKLSSQLDQVRLSPFRCSGTKGPSHIPHHHESYRQPAAETSQNPLHWRPASAGHPSTGSVSLNFLAHMLSVPYDIPILLHAEGPGWADLSGRLSMKSRQSQ